MVMGTAAKYLPRAYNTPLLMSIGCSSGSLARDELQ